MRYSYFSYRCWVQFRSGSSFSVSFRRSVNISSSKVIVVVFLVEGLRIVSKKYYYSVY